MKCAAALLLLGCTLCAGTGEQAKRAKIAELLEVTQTAKLMNQTLDENAKLMQSQIEQMNPASREAAQELQKRAQELIRSRFTYAKLEPELISLYAEVFTDSELDAMLTFYRSPAGRSVIAKMPAVMTRSIEISQRTLGDVQAEVEKIVDEVLHKPHKH